MKKDDMLLVGESANVEYKQDIPEDHLKFIKTVVAFANGKGGRLVFGVEDGSLNVTGFSKIRNKALAAAFSYMFLIEGWGTGIPKMFEQARAYGLKEPEILTMGNSFRVNLFRPVTAPVEGETTPKTDPQVGMTDPKEVDTLEKIYKLIVATPSITKQQIAEMCNLSLSGVKYNIDKFRKRGCVDWEGPSKSGHWVILKEYSEKK